jgi:hypothetical protein
MPSITARVRIEGEDPSEGGYVYAEPGMYENVAVLDVASMHPTRSRYSTSSGEYTLNFSSAQGGPSGDQAQWITRHAEQMLGGKLAPFCMTRRS